MIYLYNMFLSTIISSGFAVLFQVPRESIIFSGFTGMVQWMVYFVLRDLGVNTYFNFFIASFAAGIIAEAFARFQKKPAIIYIVPGLLPLVPGSNIYYTMLHFVKNEYNLAINQGAQTFFLAIAIAAGVVLSSVFSSSLRKKLKRDLEEIRNVINL